MTTNCQKTVYPSDSWSSRKCSRKAVKDGFCKQHHPDAEAERERKSQEAYDQKMENAPWRRLERCKEALAMCHNIIKYGAVTPEEKAYLKQLELERSAEFYEARERGEFP